MKDKWIIDGREIVLDVRKENCPQDDNIEMSGRKMSAVVYYGADENGVLNISRLAFFPTLRTIPNDTYASLRHEFGREAKISFLISGQPVSEYAVRFRISGVLTAVSRDAEGMIEIEHTVFPSVDKYVLCESVTVKNLTDQSLDISAVFPDEVSHSRGTKGVYVLEQAMTGKKETVIAPGCSENYGLIFSARILSEEGVNPDVLAELSARRSYVSDIFDGSLVLKTDDPAIDLEFAFSKLRVTESVFDTARGPMHSPGGQRYYGAIWANDEAEYAAPYFGFSGDPYGCRAIKTLMELYRPFMHPQLYRIPSSIISEGYDIWEAAGDEGDASMYLYGISRFLLGRGDREEAGRYFDTIDWCVRYIKSRICENGTVTSDSDEMEGRIASGNTNLLTNSLSYGGLVCASYLARDLGYPDKASEYSKTAEGLRKAIERVFGGQVEGYDTYMYFPGCDHVRAYSSSPLTVGIFDRAEETAKALTEKLWTGNEFLSSSGSPIFWDRSTLYSFRGFFAAGLGEKCFPFFKRYTENRLLGGRVPYPIEAWPEGDMSHLSAEGGLYARTVIEGILGITPAGFRRFILKPGISSQLCRASLSGINAFGTCFDITEELRDGLCKATITDRNGKSQVFDIPTGGSVEVFLD